MSPRDERPVDCCLDDVASVDLYVGLFAFRYGHVPMTSNPDDRSITELEYRHAVERGITYLAFLTQEDAKWSVRFVDGHTGDNAKGARITALRAELTEHAWCAGSGLPTSWRRRWPRLPRTSWSSSTTSHAGPTTPAP